MAQRIKPNRHNVNSRSFSWTLAEISMPVLGFAGGHRLLRKCIMSPDSERILKIPIEGLGRGVYWPYGRAVLCVTVDENRATN
jgi:hypothetical protein